MIVNELEYLYRIQSKVTPSFVELPNGQISYSIDLNTREINSPEVLSVKRDHLSTVIYFNVDRFYNYMDLSTLSCVIIYQTPDGKSHLYPIHYYDIYTLEKEGKMILAWNINDIATQEDGIVSYAFKFFKVTGDTVDNAKLVYSLNTFPAKSTILYGLDAPDEAFEDIEIDRTNEIIFQLQAALDKVKQLEDENFNWTIITHHLDG